MSLSFPSSPTTGQLYPSPPIAGTPVWKWDGSEWVIYSGTGVGAMLASNNLSDVANPTTARYNISAASVPDVIVEEQQPSGTGAGTFTSGSFQTRLLNTLVRNAASLASLSSNQVTLPSGTYYFRWRAPAFVVDNHKTKLRNVTDSADVALGTSSYSVSTGSGYTESTGSAVVTISASKTFSLMHQCVTTRSGNGFGVGAGFGTEVYARLEITKIA